MVCGVWGICGIVWYLFIIRCKYGDRIGIGKCLVLCDFEVIGYVRGFCYDNWVREVFGVFMLVFGCFFFCYYVLVLMFF